MNSITSECSTCSNRDTCSDRNNCNDNSSCKNDDSDGNDGAELATKPIYNIEKTIWFKTMLNYPKNLSDIKILISVMDRIKLFDQFGLAKICDMTHEKLDIIYAILRITNKIYNGHVDYIVKNIFVDNVAGLFKCNNLSSHNIFIDQLTQDFDFFVGEKISTQFPTMNKKETKEECMKLIISLISSKFYTDILKKLKYSTQESLTLITKQLVSSIIDEFASYVEENIGEIFETMTIFLRKIFNSNCSIDNINNINQSLKQHINLGDLFKEECLELDIYAEQKLYATKKPVQYYIHTTSTNPFDPFIIHKFAPTVTDLMTTLKTIGKNYDIEQERRLDTKTREFINGKIPFHKLSVNKFYQLISTIYRCNIIYLNHKSVQKIYNYSGIAMGSENEKCVIIYHKMNNFHTLCKTNKIFLPCFTSYPSIGYISEPFAKIKTSNPSMNKLCPY